MTGLAEVHQRDMDDRERLKSRCKVAPAAINRRGAYEAWQRYQQYRSLADGAFTKYMQAGMGTLTQRRHHVRYLAYSDIADGWEQVLNDWLRDVSASFNADDGAPHE